MPITQETLDMMILAMPVLLIGMAIIALLLLCFRCWRTACALLIAALSLNSWLEQIPCHIITEPLPIVKPEGTLRVLEYNVCGKSEYAPLHGEEFLDYVRSVDADVLFLPENTGGVCTGLENMLRQEYPHSLHDFETFEKECGFGDYSIYCRYPLSGFKNHKLDLQQLLVEYPYLDTLEVKRESRNMMVFEATADVDGTPVTLVHVHLRTNAYDSAIEKGGKRQKIKQLYEKLMFGYAFRKAEAEAMADSLANCPNPLIVCGDFNDFSGSRCIQTIQDCRRNNIYPDHRDRLRDAWWDGGCGMGFTFVDLGLYLRLDHLLYSKEFRLRAVDVPRKPYSDHCPLIVDLELK